MLLKRKRFIRHIGICVWFAYRPRSYYRVEVCCGWFCGSASACAVLDACHRTFRVYHARQQDRGGWTGVSNPSIGYLSLSCFIVWASRLSCLICLPLVRHSLKWDDSFTIMMVGGLVVVTPSIMASYFIILNGIRGIASSGRLASDVFPSIRKRDQK